MLSVRNKASFLILLEFLVKEYSDLGMVDMADETPPPPPIDDIAEPRPPVMFSELLDEEFDISPPWKKKFRFVKFC